MADEYIIPLSIDVAGVVSKSTQVKTSLTEVGEAAKKAGTEAKDSFDKAGKGATDLSSKLVDNSQKFGTLTKNVEQLTIQMQSYDRVAKTSLDPKIITEYNQKAEALKNQISQLSNVGKKGFDDLGNKIDDNTKKASLFRDTLKSIGGFLVATFAVREIISFAKEVATLGAKAEGVKAAFDRINAPDLLSNLRAATRGTISDLQLMQNAVLANQFNIPLDRLATLYKFAFDRARALGKDTASFVDQVISGTARGSVRILDNLGISQAEVRSEVKKTGDFTTAVFNVIQKELDKTGDTALKNADRFGQIGATIENIKVTLGTSSSGVFAFLANAVNTYLNFLNIALKSTDDRLTELGTKFGTQDNKKLISDFTKDSPAERAKAIAGYESLIKRQTQAVADYDKKIADVQNNLNLLQKIGRAAFTDLNDNLENKRNTQIVLLAEFKAELESLKGVEDKEKGDAERKRLINEANAKKEEERQRQLLSLRKKLNDELVRLRNEFNQSEIAAIEDQTTKEVAKNDVDYQSKIRTLEQQKADLASEAKANALKFPELAGKYKEVIRQINIDIAKIDQEGQAASQAIIDKGALQRLKAQQDSLRQIGVLLKDETSARIEAVKANYEKVIIEAKKNGVLTNELEKKLARQQQSDISDIQSKAVIDRLNDQESLKEALIKTENQRSGETQKQYENRIQQELLDVVIEFAKKRVEVLAATLAINGSLTEAQIKEFAKNIEAIRNATNKKTDNKVPEKKNIFEVLGINDIDAGKLQDAFQKTTDSLSGVFSGLAEMADRSVQAIQKQIDAIDKLLQADQDAVDKQQALSDKGRANSLDAAKKKLSDDQKLKEQLQKQEEKAQKKKQDLQRAALAADSIQQVSGLITSSVNIFESLSKIPFIGIPLAIATIGAMFAAFGVAKANAFSAVNSQTAEEGGVAGGDRHSSGGNKYVSMDGKDKNILEIERGERIFSRKNSEKHKKLFEAIQNNDYSKLDISDVSIRDLLRGTGVMQQLEVAQRVGNQNITLQDRANSVVIVTGNSDKYLSSIDKKMDGLNRREPIIIDYGDYVWIDHGNGHTEKRYK